MHRIEWNGMEYKSKIVFIHTTGKYLFQWIDDGTRRERESGREEQGERGAQLKEWLSHLISITLKFPCHSIGVFENRKIVHEMIAAAAVCDYRIFTNGWQSSKVVIFFLLLARCCHFISYKLKWTRIKLRLTLEPHFVARKNSAFWI